MFVSTDIHATALMSNWERYGGPVPCHAATFENADFVPQAREKEEAGLRGELVDDLSLLSNVRTLSSPCDVFRLSAILQVCWLA